MKRGKGLHKRMYTRFAAVAMTALLVSGMLTGCGQQTAGAADGEETAVTVSAQAKTAAAMSELFTSRDLTADYETSESVAITLEGDSASCPSDSVQISDGTVTITEEGIYVLSGTLSDGMIVVDAGEEDKVQLVLDGASVTNSSNAAIYVRQADKVFVTLAEGSSNSLESDSYTSIDDNNIDACIFSKCDLTVNGAGSLTVSAVQGHGIVSKDDLRITGGELTVTAAAHGICGKDSVRIADGTITVNAGKDAIHSENDDDAQKGNVYLAGGVYTLTAGGDGISAGSTLQISDGDFSITTGQGSAGTGTSLTEDGDTASTKGLKAGTELIVDGGEFVIDSEDDAIHSNGSVTVNGGTLQLASGDDGIHADETAQITGGSLTIALCYEGIEGKQVVISGGNITLYATDDGLNAAGGESFGGFGGAGSSDSSIVISGGVINVVADGDGIDSNGDFTMTGGEVYVSGPSNNANGALDYDGTGCITGGKLVAVGASGMAMNFGDTSTQGSILLTTASCQAGAQIVLKAADGTTLLSYTAQKAFDSVVLSCPELTLGETYVVCVDGEETEVTLDSLIYGNGFGGMGAPGGFGGMGMPGDFDAADAPERPDGKGTPGEFDSTDAPERPDGADVPGSFEGTDAPQRPDGTGAPAMPGGGGRPGDPRGQESASDSSQQ